MIPNQDQIVDAARNNLANQISTLMTMTGATMESMERLLDLNLNVVRASMEESAAISRQFMDARDPQTFFTLFVAQAKPNAEKALAYSRHLVSIAANAQEGISRAAEAQFAETNRRMAQLMETAAKNAPAGSENVVAAVKTALDNAGAGVEQLHRTSRQAAEAIEATMTAAVTRFAKAPDPVSAAATAATNAATSAAAAATGTTQA